MTGKKESAVYLLDTSYFIFRSYHALPGLTTAEGLPTNAVHGVASMFEKLLRTRKPGWIVAAFDSGRKTFRNELYPDYKANRDEPDEELRVQFPLVERLAEAMGIRCVRRDNYEADDLLASMARHFSAQGHPVVIVTGDKDLMQCVGEGVTLYDAAKGVDVGEEQVMEKFGVPPGGVVDVLGLMGDSSDNIPGVRGVGPKTARVLMEHFGSMDEMYARLDEVKDLKLRGAASVHSKLEAGREAAELSRDLATVRDQLDVDFSLDDIRVVSPYRSELVELAEELEMSRMLSRFRDLTPGADAVDAARTDKDGPTAAVQTGLFDGAGDSAAGDSAAGDSVAGDSVAGDSAAGGSAKANSDVQSPVEESGIDWRELKGPELYFHIKPGGEGEQSAGPCLLLGGEQGWALLQGRQELVDCLARAAQSGVELLGFDIKLLCREAGLEATPAGFDLGLASYLCDPGAGAHDRARVCPRWLDEEAVDEEDSAALLAQLERLAVELGGEVDSRGQRGIYDELEYPLVAVLASMEARGMLLDLDLLKSLSADFGSRMEGLVSSIYEASGEEFNILSPLQLREVLFEKLGLPTKGVKKTKTGFSTDSDTLVALSGSHPLPALVLEYRGLAKLKSTYVDALPRLVDKQGLVHTHLNQQVTATGRLSSSDPNLQNIPVRSQDGGRIRKAFIVPEGQLLVSADYNQIELRVLADLSGDPGLGGAFERGEDVHRATAAEIFEVAPDQVSKQMRREAKVINFGIVYGMGPVRLSRELDIPRTQASDFIKRYFQRYPAVQGFFDEMLEQARATGYVATRLGRRRYLHDIDSDHGGRRQAAERVATNTPIQGGAADIIKMAMVEVERRLGESGSGAMMLLQVHDELLLQCAVEDEPELAEMLRSAMQSVAELSVPVLVDVGSGRSWAEAH
ncbi:MAG: DNA polymerase I [Proteobacteria bacterium]|nr:DNA polymerase I [Pseudomonadota bacterium]